MSAGNETAAPGAAWIEIIRRPSLEAFEEAFVEEAVLEASILRTVVNGPADIRLVFVATASIYESIAFTHETIRGVKTYLEWAGTALGGRPAAGVTVLTRGRGGRIESVTLMHRPYDMVVDFSAELYRRLVGKLPSEALSH